MGPADYLSNHAQASECTHFASFLLSHVKSTGEILSLTKENLSREKHEGFCCWPYIIQMLVAYLPTVWDVKEGHPSQTVGKGHISATNPLVWPGSMQKMTGQAAFSPMKAPWAHKERKPWLMGTWLYKSVWSEVAKLSSSKVSDYHVMGWWDRPWTSFGRAVCPPALCKDNCHSFIGSLTLPAGNVVSMGYALKRTLGQSNACLALMVRTGL